MRSQQSLNEFLVTSALFLSWGIVVGANYPDLRFFWLGLFLIIAVIQYFFPLAPATKKLYCFCFLGGLIHVAFHFESIRNSPPVPEFMEILKVQKLDDGNRFFESLILLPAKEAGQKLRIHTKEPIFAAKGAILELRKVKIEPEYHLGHWYIRGFAEDVSPVRNLDHDSILLRIYHSWYDYRIFVQNKAKEMAEGFPLVKQFLLEAILGVRGDKKSLKNSLKPLGLGHVFTISGFHLSLWGLICIFCLKRCTSSLKIQWSGYIFALFLYAFIVEFKPSVLRALVFGILLFSGSQLSRPVNPFRILALTFWIHFLLFPLDALTPAFHLTYGITFYLLLIAEYSRSDWRINLFWLALLHILLCPYFLFLFGDFPLGSLIGILFSSALGLAIGALMLALTLSLVSGSFQALLSPIFNIIEMGLNGLTELASYVDYRLILMPTLPIEFLILFYFLIFLGGVFFCRKIHHSAQADLQILNSVRVYCTRNIHFPRERFKKELHYSLRSIARSYGYQKKDIVILLASITEKWTSDMKLKEFYPFLWGPFSLLWDLEMPGHQIKILELKSLKIKNFASLEERFLHLNKRISGLLVQNQLDHSSSLRGLLSIVLVSRRECQSIVKELGLLRKQLNYVEG